MTIEMLGIDIAKNVFQLHGVNHSFTRPLRPWYSLGHGGASIPTRLSPGRTVEQIVGSHFMIPAEGDNPAALR